MADFCRACTVDMWGDLDGVTGDDNDLVNHLVVGWAWWLCEGCGWHQFDGTGTRLCTSPPPGMPRADRVPDPVSLDPCTACTYLAGALGDPPPG
jgi:hypothetical protein